MFITRPHELSSSLDNVYCEISNAPVSTLRANMNFCSKSYTLVELEYNVRTELLWCGVLSAHTLVSLIRMLAPQRWPHRTKRRKENKKNLHHRADISVGCCATMTLGNVRRASLIHQSNASEYMHNCGDGLTLDPYVCAQNKEHIPIDTWVAEKLTSSPDPSLCGACKPFPLHWWCCSRFGCLFSCVQMRRQIVCVTSYLPSAHIVMQDIDAMTEKSNSLPQRACSHRSHRIHTLNHIHRSNNITPGTFEMCTVTLTHLGTWSETKNEKCSADMQTPATNRLIVRCGYSMRQ